VAFGGSVTRVSSGVAGKVPADDYVRSLPRKRMAAGALFVNNASRILLVDPVYRDTWDLPGGAVEAEESPYAACRREVAEELGLDRPPGRILAVDWVPSRARRPEGLVVVYDGGMLRTVEIDAITLPEDELSGFAFVAAEEVATRTTLLVGRRIAASLQAKAAGTVVSLEDGCVVG
jgi:8-oxo-dGTP pyrophosphatase MutT (NUDIX family)